MIRIILIILLFNTNFLLESGEEEAHLTLFKDFDLEPFWGDEGGNLANKDYHLITKGLGIDKEAERREACREACKRYRENRGDRVRASQKAYYLAHPQAAEKRRAYAKEIRANMTQQQKDEINAKKRAAYAKKREEKQINAFAAGIAAPEPAAEPAKTNKKRVKPGQQAGAKKALKIKKS